MQPEVNEKEEKRTKVSVTVPDVPIEVHEKMERYKRRIMADRQKDYTLMQAYCEWLIESTGNLVV